MNSRRTRTGVGEEAAADAVLSRIGAGGSEVRYARDQFVYSQGEQAESVFYLSAGRIKVLMVSEEGKGAVLLGCISIR